MTDEYMLERGYRKFNPIPRIDNEHVVARFQKRFDDDFGKKYFINVVKWDNSYIPETHRGNWYKLYSYEYDTQFSIGKDDNALDMTFHSSWTLEQVEDFIESFFKRMKPNYYEDWDERRCVRPPEELEDKDCDSK